MKSIYLKVTWSLCSRLLNQKTDFDEPTGVMFDKNRNNLVADRVNGFIHTFSRKLQSIEYEYKGRKFGEKKVS